MLGRSQACVGRTVPNFGRHRAIIIARQLFKSDVYMCVPVIQVAVMFTHANWYCALHTTAAGWVSYGQKWKTVTGRVETIFTDIIGLFSTTVT